MPFEVRATDAAGNVGSATSAVTIDTLAPTVTILTGVAEGGLTNDRTPTWTFATTGDPTLIRCRIDLQPATPCTTSTSHTTWPPIGDGDSTLRIWVIDAAGNQTVVERNFTIDGTPPSAHIIGGDGLVTNDPTPLWNYHTDHGPTVNECRLDNDPFGPCTTSTTHLSPTLADGPHTFHLRATDAAGNEATDSVAFTVDTVAPVVEITSGPTSTVFSNVARFTWVVTGATAVECATYLLGQSPSTWVPCTSPRDQPVPAFTGPSATFRFHVRAPDGAGNLGEATRDFTAGHLP